MEYVVSGNLTKINFDATGTQEVLQNVQMILATVAFSCPMNRDFAWTPSVDAPINVAKARMSAQIVNAVRTYEPRAKVTSISYDVDAESGALKPKVKVSVDNG